MIFNCKLIVIFKILIFQIDLKRPDRSIDVTSNLNKTGTIIDDDSTLDVIHVTNSPTEKSAQKNSNVLGLDLNKQPCGIPDIRPYFENTVNNIRRWLDSIIDECNKVEGITTENIETIRKSCAQLKNNYLKLFQLIINPLNHLNGNLTVVNNTCSIIAGLENIRNNVMNFTLWPENIISRNNSFSNIIQKFRNFFSTKYGTLPNTSTSVNSSDVKSNISFPEKCTMAQCNIINNLLNLPQKIRQSIDKLIRNVTNIINLQKYKELKAVTDSSINNQFNTFIQERISCQNRSHELFKNILLHNPLIQSFNSIQNFPQQIRESIDKFISDVRSIFIPQNSRDVKTVTNTSTNGQLNNGTDIPDQGEFLFQKPSNGLFNNIWNISSSAKSSSNRLFNQALDNLQNMPQRIQESIDKFISDVRRIFNSSNSAKSPSSNFFIQSLEALRNMPQQIRESIDKFISEVRNIFVQQDSKIVVAKTNNAISNQLNNVMNTFVDKDSMVRNFNEFFKNICQFLTPKEFSSGNLLTQSLDNLRNLPQQISNSINDLINNVVNIFTINDCKKHKGMVNFPINNRISNANHNLIYKASTFQNFFNGLFKKSLPTQQVSSTRKDLPYLSAFSKHYSFPRKRRNSYKCSTARKCL